MPNHGGARPGAGRKPRSASPATIDVHLRLTPEEHAALTAARGNVTLSEFIRDAALRAARRRKKP